MNLAEISLPLHRIIPFSNVEGRGNRCAVFLQGCKLNCLYCHNPETIPRYTAEAKLVSLQYLFEQIMEARPFIRGVTFSGGEPTLHHQKLLPLCQALRTQGLSIYLDSSGFFEFDKIRPLIKVCDKFLFDLKGDGEGLGALCFDRQNRTGRVLPNLPQRPLRPQNLTRNLHNLQQLLTLNKVEEVRLVLINGFFDAEELVKKTAQLLRPYPDVLFTLIRVHNQGTRDAAGLSPLIPSIEQTQALGKFARTQGLNNLSIIL